ncbi:MAG: hypothetical protein V9G13_08120 [Marmoricola sp.]
MNPKYYDRMSELLDAILEERRQGALDYKDYLDEAARAGRQAARQGRRSRTPSTPTWADNGARRALCRLLLPRRCIWRSRSTRVVRHTKPDSWVGNAIKEKKVKQRHPRQDLPDDFDRPARRTV